MAVHRRPNRNEGAARLRARRRSQHPGQGVDGLRTVPRETVPLDHHRRHQIALRAGTFRGDHDTSSATGFTMLENSGTSIGRPTSIDR